MECWKWSCLLKIYIGVSSLLSIIIYICHFYCSSVSFSIILITVAIEELRSISDSTQIEPPPNIQRLTSEGVKYFLY